MKVKLNSKLVEIQRRRLGLLPKDIAPLLGFKSRQGYVDMIKRQSISKSSYLAKLFDMDERALVIFE